jgi:hypothetical protein
MVSRLLLLLPLIWTVAIKKEPKVKFEEYATAKVADPIAPWFDCLNIMTHVHHTSKKSIAP